MCIWQHMLSRLNDALQASNRPMTTILQQVGVILEAAVQRLEPKRGKSVSTIPLSMSLRITISDVYL